MKEPMLIILAAGMGSRYGGLKQIDTVGTNGESIIDFTIYDAIEAGFKKVGLIIRKEHQKAFEEKLVNKIRKKVEVEFIYQDLNDIPSEFKVPEGRVKPWGTTHALLACRHIDVPFMICNADDYYGKDAFKTMYNFLKYEVKDDEYGMVGYELINTITSSGTVTRAICKKENGYLKESEEIQNDKKDGDKAIYLKDNKWIEADPISISSMNYLGFTPKIFEECEQIFVDFLHRELEGNPMKCEHVIPTAVGDLIKTGKVKVKVMSTKDAWFGVTYKEDRPEVYNRLKEYKEKGLYPFDLWA